MSTYGVISWQREFPALTFNYTPDGGSAQSETIGGTVAYGFRPAAQGTLDAHEESAQQQTADVLAAVVGASSGSATYTTPGRRIGWDLLLEGVPSLEGLFTITVPGGSAAARDWGSDTTTIVGVNTGPGEWLFEFSGAHMAALWNGGCDRVVNDEPDDRYRTMVSSSPYTVGANTHVAIGSRSYRRVRWVYVDGAFIHRLQAADPLFADQAGRDTDETNNIFDGFLAEAGSTGAPLVLSVDRREPVEVQLVDEDPAVSDYVTQAAQSGRRYDVELNMEVIES